jgi:hypothetical protein
MLANRLEQLPLLHASPGIFRDDFDRKCFTFTHRLADNPIFDPARVVELAQLMTQDPRDVYYDAGDVGIGQRWATVPVTGLSVEQLLHRIDTANAWIVLFNVQKDPAYAEILERCMAEIEAECGRDMRDLMKLRQAILFVNSPHRVSSYHIDRECSLLLQMRGHKTISIFDRDDRDVLPEREIETFWTTDNNAPVYRAEYENRATVYELSPGGGVHIPVNCPHWVQNGSEVSVSLNINFHYKDRLLGDVYRMNALLRRFGLRPTPPRRFALLDTAKGTLYDSVRELRRTVRNKGRL